MMFIRTVCACSALAVCMALFQTPSELPEGWVSTAADQAELMPVTLSLRNRNMGKFTEHVLEITNPASTKYAEYMSNEEIRDMIAPAPADLASVEGWLKSYGIEYTISTLHDKIQLHSTVGQVQRLLSTQVQKVELGSQKAFRADAITIPSELHIVESVFGVHGLPLPANSPYTISPVKSSAPEVNVKVTPKVIESTYNISGVTITGSTTNRQAVAEFQSQFWRPDDGTKFFQDFVPNAPSGADAIYKVVGKNDPSFSGDEAALDVEYIMGVAPGLKTEFWSWPQSQFCADLVQWSEKIYSDTDGPNVHSVSYGWQGKITQICNAANVPIVDGEFTKIAAKGITVIFASGDSGSGYTCTGLKCKLYPSWPASSQWVTSVGSTRFIDQNEQKGEMATDQFGSGGGFSWDLSMPSWQTEAVAGYMKIATDIPPANEYNATGRATPDLAALGEDFQVVINGETQGIGGTSASAPTWASIVSLLNEKRAAAGKKPLGYLNQWIWGAASKAFTDVTVGNNRISRSGFPVKHGWSCAVGWDPVTGFGVPDFPKLVAAMP
eukprot:NODE_556_length_1813_cov_78.174377_g547_i0.p1 GENE.NODE_556_length_1813_cov_78.174377_g547_i0~~NODE_556_length_1813_cov_78.174377_g547_i0.p1  ORF type:complete len:553 (+),score=148.18 NODE_556_length_1813_cov_78.174377_g547_i0:71-1729(+)